MPEADHTVSISGGKGVVVGDYATVFQAFASSPPSIASYIRDGQFRPLVDQRSKSFVGREFVFEGVDRALASDSFESGYVVIRGEPGIGKSAVASILVLRRRCVHHFNIAAGNIRTPRQFLENVCAQLIARHDLAHQVLPPNAGEDAGFLSQLLGEAADAAGRRGELPVVVVVDALDEADDVGLAPDANRLFLPPTLPPGVFFVITAREEDDYRLTVDNSLEIVIRDDGAENIRDVERYVAAYIAQRADVMHSRISEWGLDVERFVAEMVSLSEGNFMYLVYVLPDIELRRLSGETVGGVQGLPRGLTGYYTRHWREMKDHNEARFAGVQRPVLCFLAISREPVTIEQLADWTQLEATAVNSVVREWREFLNEDVTADPPVYRIYHRSFADFLDRQEDLHLYHERLANTALGKIPGFLGA